MLFEKTNLFVLWFLFLCLSMLNPSQQEAVDHVSGPLLILAGAGAGKTHTLTERIAALIERDRVQPGSILAVTFTNKAAKEMRERMGKRLGFSLE